jgi:YcxB-like protein
MPVRFALTQDDYLEAQRSFTMATGSQRLVLRGLQVFGVILVLVGLLNLAANPTSPLPSIFPAVLGLLWLAMPWINTWKLRRDFRGSPSLAGEVELSVSDGGLEITSPVGTAQIRWAAFARYIESPNLFLLFEGPRIFRIVPKRAFAPADLENFRTLLTAHIRPR